MSVHDIDMAVTNFPLISQVEASRGTTLFALDVLRTPRSTSDLQALILNYF